MITALGGGVGAAKFLKGLTGLVPNEELTLIINTADDIELYGFNISPDIDTVIYRLSDNIDTEKGWGLRGDSSIILDSLSGFGIERRWVHRGCGGSSRPLPRSIHHPCGS